MTKIKRMKWRHIHPYDLWECEVVRGDGFVAALIHDDAGEPRYYQLESMLRDDVSRHETLEGAKDEAQRQMEEFILNWLEDEE